MYCNNVGCGCSWTKYIFQSSSRKMGQLTVHMRYWLPMTKLWQHALTKQQHHCTFTLLYLLRMHFTKRVWQVLTTTGHICRIIFNIMCDWGEAGRVSIIHKCILLIQDGYMGWKVEAMLLDIALQLIQFSDVLKKHWFIGHGIFHILIISR